MSEKKILYNVTLLETKIEKDFCIDSDIYKLHHNVIKRIVYVNDIDKLIKGMNVILNDDNILFKPNIDLHDSVDHIHYFELELIEYKEYQH